MGSRRSSNVRGIKKLLAELERKRGTSAKMVVLLPDNETVTLTGRDADTLFFLRGTGGADLDTEAAARADLLRRSIGTIPPCGLWDVMRAIALSPTE
jgi:hypothetical protein